MNPVSAARIGAKRAAKRVLRPLLYRFPPVFLSAAGLMQWLDAIRDAEAVEGDIVEIGCYLGGTAILGAKLLDEMASAKRYVVVDTFGGFVDEQFDAEVAIGGAPGLRHHFSNNTEALTRWVLDRHGAGAVAMVQGDIATLDPARLPRRIAACLIDIDLAEPIHAALRKVFPLLSEGGAIIVDDCDERTMYKARLGYSRFVEEHGLPHDIRFGKGIVRRPVAASGLAAPGSGAPARFAYSD